MVVVERWVRAVACAVCAGLIASEAAAAPLGATAVADASVRPPAGAPVAALVDVCAGGAGIGACDPRGLGELVASPVTLFDGFAAQAGEAAGASGTFADLHVQRPVAWALLTAAMAASGTPTRLALAAAIRPGAADAETTLIADVAGMVRQVPEPPALGLLLSGLALAGACFRRPRVRR